MSTLPKITERTYTTRGMSFGSEADYARAHGLVPGTRLAGDEGFGVTVIEITNLEPKKIRAKQISHGGHEHHGDIQSWTLSCRDWRIVIDDPCSPVSEES